MKHPAVTILLPVYNEVGTVGRMLASLKRLQPRAEIIAIDDGSTDGSDRVLKSWARRGVRILSHARNRGKGSAVRTGLQAARGRWIVIQDADLETDPRDLPRLLRPLRKGSVVAVFGTRFGPGHGGRAAWRLTRVANRIITGAVNRLFGGRLSDVACAYKAAPATLLRSLGLQARRFEFEAELAARLLRRGIPIVEVPIRYAPRTYRDGKKIHAFDGVRILAALIRLRAGA